MFYHKDVLQVIALQSQKSVCFHHVGWIKTPTPYDLMETLTDQKKQMIEINEYYLYCIICYCKRSS